MENTSETIIEIDNTAADNKTNQIDNKTNNQTNNQSNKVENPIENVKLVAFNLWASVILTVECIYKKIKETYRKTYNFIMRKIKREQPEAI